MMEAPPQRDFAQVIVLPSESEIAEREIQRKKRMAFGQGTIEDWEIEREQLKALNLDTSPADLRIRSLHTQRLRAQYQDAESRARSWKVGFWFLAGLLVLATAAALRR